MDSGVPIFKNGKIGHFGKKISFQSSLGDAVVFGIRYPSNEPNETFQLAPKVKGSSKNFSFFFRFSPSCHFHKTGPHKSTGTKIFGKLVQKVDQRGSRKFSIDLKVLRDPFWPTFWTSFPKILVPVDSWGPLLWKWQEGENRKKNEKFLDDGSHLKNIALTTALVVIFPCSIFQNKHH